MRRGFVPLSERSKRHAEVAMGFRWHRPDRERMPIVPRRLVMAAMLQVRVGEREMRAGVVAPQLGDLREMPDRLVEPPERAQDLPHVEMAVGVAPVDRDRLADQLERSIVAADAGHDHAKQMQRIRMIAVEREGIAAQPLGFVELSGLEMPDRAREQVAGKRARARPGRHDAALAPLCGRASILAIHA
jgi:hypothetical protein